MRGAFCSLAVMFLALVSVERPSEAAAFQFQEVRPGYAFSFPRDHASHDLYRTEWWYYSGVLVTPGGGRFGYQLTFFRSGIDPGSKNPSRWTARHLYFAHFAMSDREGRRHVYFEKMNRAGIGFAGARSDRAHVWNEDWSAELSGGLHRLRARGGSFEIQLDLEPTKPPVVHGEKGISRKGEGPGEASFYVSLTRMRTSGVLVVERQLLPVTGESWMDHEWTSADLAPALAGWDWFGLRLSDGRDLMIYRLRSREGKGPPVVSGSLVRPDGSTRHLSAADIRLSPGRTWASPKSGAQYPVRWRVEVPIERIVLDVRAAFPEQELVTSESTRVTYWEGVVAATGEAGGQPVTGEGYMEMTGYAGE